MFQSGTNFGFMNGANDVQKNGHSRVDVTSYDYDAPISEAGIKEFFKLDRKRFFLVLKLFLFLINKRLLPQMLENKGID
jgi:hypothetical protein